MRRGGYCETMEAWRANVRPLRHDGKCETIEAGRATSGGSFCKNGEDSPIYREVMRTGVAV